MILEGGGGGLSAGSSASAVGRRGHVAVGRTLAAGPGRGCAGAGGGSRSEAVCGFAFEAGEALVVADVGEDLPC